MLENGMDKLIELLNEYEIEKKKEIGEITYVWTNAEGLLFAKRHGINALSILETRAVLVNKEYGFIKWLVDNDKIDLVLDSIIHKHKGIDFDTGKGIVVEKLCDRYESLLMLLSIQDNPIEFLVSVLK